MSDISTYEKRIRYTEALNSLSEIRSHVLYQDQLDDRYAEILKDALEIAELDTPDAKAKAFSYGFHNGSDVSRSAALELSHAVKKYFKDNNTQFKRFKQQVTDQVFLKKAQLLVDEILVKDCEEIIQILLEEIETIRPTPITL